MDAATSSAVGSLTTPVAGCEGEDGPAIVSGLMGPIPTPLSSPQDVVTSRASAVTLVRPTPRRQLVAVIFVFFNFTLRSSADRLPEIESVYVTAETAAT